MANLKYGSSGDDVKKLQEALGFTGSDVDGIYGQKTQAAVKDYQKNNGLTVDGIAGEQTLGKLYGNSTPANDANTSNNEQQNTTNQNKEFSYDEFKYEDFDPMGDETIKQAWDILQQNNANKPGSYTPVWQDKADSYLTQYQERDPYSYNFNEDAMYLQAKDNYLQQGKMGMMDTMGQAAALTGGYGNSFAQTAGQQVYNQHLTQLNEIIPELSQMAFDRYTQEGQDLLAMYDLYMGRENQEYGRHQDSVDRWMQENAMLTDQYNTAYNRGWNEYLTGRNEAMAMWQDDKNIAYDMWQQSKQDQKENYDQLVSMITTLGYEPTEEELAAAGMSQEQYQSYKDYYTQSKRTGGGGTRQKTYKTLTGDEGDKWAKRFLEAGSLDGVEEIGDRMQDEGYDPQVVARWVSNYSQGYKDKNAAWDNLNAVGNYFLDKLFK